MLNHHLSHIVLSLVTFVPALARAQAPTEFRPETYANIGGTCTTGADCNNLGVCDLTPSSPTYQTCVAPNTWDATFAAMLQDSACSPPTGPNANYRRVGCVVRLACNTDYVFANTLELCRGHDIRGCGRGNAYASSRLVFPNDTTGVHVPGYNSQALQSYCISEPDAIGDGPALRDLMLLGAGTNPSAHGIHVQGLAHLDRVFVALFGGNGVYITNSRPGGGIGGNASLFHIQDIYAQLNGRHGLLIEGNTSNQGMILHSTFKSNCRGLNPSTHNPSADPATWPCVEVRDRSTLGNTFVGTHANNGLWPEYLMSESDTMRSVCVNCYAEGGGPVSHMRYALLLGGFIHANEQTGGPSWQDRTLSGDLHFENKVDPTNTTIMRIGRNAPRGYIRYQNSAAPTDWWQSLYQSSNGTFRMHHGSAGAPTAYSMTGNTSSSGALVLTPGRMWMEDYYLGVNGGTIRVGAGPLSHRPAGAALSTWPVGSRFMNSSAAASNDVTEWVLICSAGQKQSTGNCTTPGVKTWVPVATVP